MSHDAMNEEEDLDQLLDFIKPKSTVTTATTVDQKHSIKRKIEERLERRKLKDEYGFIEDF